MPGSHRCSRWPEASWSAAAERFPVPAAALVGTVLVAIPLVFGFSIRVRRQAQADLAERERRSEQEQAARAVLQERARIARELHDVVAHHMSVIAIQAEAAPLRTPGGPAGLVDDLTDIRRTALEAAHRDAQFLGILREDDRAEATPQPGLARLGGLAENAKAAGLTVT